MYKVKFYNKDRMYFYLFNNKQFVDKYLTFTSLIEYIETNNINFKYVRLNCNFDDLFYHIVDYNSVQRLNNYNKFQEEKKKLLKESKK